MTDELGTEFGCRAHGMLDYVTIDGRFPLPGDKPHYPRDRSVDIKHVRLDFSLDLLAGAHRRFGRAHFQSYQ